ncbi:hypothetical protein AB6V67_03495 [Serratia marcescens]|uniref:hypothetical protein n=1 Tax=Serratia marcescens TaxID=615 RepID=UPI002FDABBCB
MTLTDYIAAYFGGNKSAFARHMAVNPQQVTKWVADGWIVDNHTLYSPRRTVPENITSANTAEE